MPCIPQSSSITETSPSDFLVLCPGHTLVGGCYRSSEKPSVFYSPSSGSRLSNTSKRNFAMGTAQLQAILMKSWWQHTQKISVVSRLITHCSLSEVLQSDPTHRHTSSEWPAKTHIRKLCENSGCRLENLLLARDGLRVRIKEIRAIGTSLWWSWGNPRILLIIYLQ